MSLQRLPYSVSADDRVTRTIVSGLVILCAAALLITSGAPVADAIVESPAPAEGTVRLPGPELPAVGDTESPHPFARSAARLEAARQYHGWAFKWEPGDGGVLTAVGNLPATGDPATFVDRFVRDQGGRLGIGPGDLLSIDVRTAGAIEHHFFHQAYKGIEVDGSRIGFGFAADGSPIYLSARTAPDIDLLTTQPALSLEDAQARAFDGLAEPQQIEWTEGRLVVLPRRFSGLGEDRLAWRMRCRTNEAENAWRMLVDALSGAVLERRSLKISAEEIFVEGDVQGLIHQPTTWGEETLVRFPDLAVTAMEGETALSETLTDSDGHFSFGDLEVSDPSQLALVGTLAGSYAVIFEERPFSPLREVRIENPTLPATIHWDSAGASEPSLAAFYHANTAHSRFKSFDPSFSALDIPIWVITNNTSDVCNAFATLDPTYPMLTFLAETENCANTAMLANVVYHEYGHLATMYSYLPEWPNSTLHEAFSDYFAATIDDTSTIGIDFFGPGTFLRELDNDMTPPLDPDCASDPHCEGLLLAGALWDMRTALIDNFADRDEAVAYADQLFHYMRYGRPMDFDACLVQLLVQDDDDGDISNGTPHLDLIAAGFERHGIGDFDVHITHTPLYDTEDTTTPRVITVSLSSIYPLDPGSIQLHYRTASGAAFTNTTMEGSIWDYEQEIPAQPEGTVVQYYLSAADETGRTATLPVDAPVTYFSYIVGVDEIPPEVTHDAPRDLTTDQERLWLRADVTDNIGQIDSVWAQATVLSGDDTVHVAFDLTPKESERIPDLYEGVLSVGAQEAGAQVTYYVVAQDGSSQKNEIRLPPEGELSLDVYPGRFWDFEEATSGLSLDGDWELGTPTAGPSTAYTGTQLVGTVLDGAHSVGLVSSAITPEIDLTQWTEALLEFRSWYQTEENWDGGRIRISTDNGESWDVLTPGDGYPNWIFDPDNPFQAPVLPAFTGDGAQWRTVLVPLDFYLGTTVQIRFDYMSDVSVVDLGWYLDDLTVIESQALVAPIWLDASTGEDGLVTLVWPEPIGIDTISDNFKGYIVYRTPVSGTEPLEEIAQTGESIYVDTDVDNGSKYYYTVSCLYLSGESSQSPQAVGYPYRAGLGVASEIDFELDGVATIIDTLRIENAGTGELHLDILQADPEDQWSDLVPQFFPDGVDDDAPTVLALDPIDSSAPDLANFSCLESAGELTFQFALHDSVPNPQQDFSLMIYLDTDISRSTGLVDGNVGADYMVAMGAAVYEQAGVPAFILIVVGDDQVYPMALPSEWSLEEGNTEISVTFPWSLIGAPRTIGFGARVLMPGEDPFGRNGAAEESVEKVCPDKPLPWNRLLQAVIAVRDEEDPIGDRLPDPRQSTWLTISETTALATPEDPVELALNIDFTGWGRGDYGSKLFIPTNDPDQPLGEVAIDAFVWYLPPEGLTYWATTSLDEGLLLEWSPAQPDSFGGFLLYRWQGEEIDEDSAVLLGAGAIGSIDDSLYQYLDRTVENGERYFFRLSGVTTDGDTLMISPPSYPLYDPSVPARLAMQPPWPNPFGASLSFRIHAPEGGEWDLFIVDVSGRRVRSLVRKGEKGSGIHVVPWDGRNDNGERVAQGVYYAVARIGGSQVTRSAILVR